MGLLAKSNFTVVYIYKCGRTGRGSTSEYYKTLKSKAELDGQSVNASQDGLLMINNAPVFSVQQRFIQGCHGYDIWHPNFEDIQNYPWIYDISISKFINDGPA